MDHAKTDETAFHGIAAILAGMVAMSANDMLVKFLGDGFPLHQIIFTRASIAILVTLVIMHLEGGFLNLKTHNKGIHLLRGILVVCANMLFFLGLFVMPLAEVTALYFVAPLFMSLLAVPILGERIRLPRLAAVLAGFAGVMVIVRPGGDFFTPLALLPLGSAALYSLLQILTRRIGISEKASTMAFYTQLSFIVFSAGFGLMFGAGNVAYTPGTPAEFLFKPWVWPDTRQALLLLSLGIVSSAVGYFITQAYRLAHVSVVSPFEYAALPLAIIWGWLVWGDLPEQLAWLGIALIGGAGLFMALYENRNRKRAFAARSRAPVV